MVREWIVLVVVLFALSSSALRAQEPTKKGLMPSYSVTCKVSRAFLEADEQGRQKLAKSSTTLPDIIALEASKAEYISERKVMAGSFQFRVQVQVVRVSEAKVRIDVTAEDIWSEGDLEKPIVHKHSLQTTRQMDLGGKLKLELMEKNDSGEAIWVELSVKEYREKQ